MTILRLRGHCSLYFYWQLLQLVEPALHARIQLVPPSLSVIAALITYKKSLQYVVAQLEDKCYMGTSYAELASCNMPLVKVASAKIGNGLTVSYTETYRRGKGGEWIPKVGLLWVNELACHPTCAFLGRICQGNLSTYEWLEKIEKKHLEWLDKIPTV
jgi:hypothetical protein